MNDIELLRHTVATLGYRAAKTFRGASADFGAFHASEGGRTPAEIVGHMGDLFDWALSIANGQERWSNSGPLEWDAAVARFFAAVEAFDQRLAAAGAGEPLGAPPTKLFQGPIADALTHTGQIAMLRRMAGQAVRGENYFRAHIEIGRAGAEQAASVREFD